MKFPLVPQGPKSEWSQQASRIANGEIPVADSDLPVLLKWLQDLNWPGAATIAEFIRRRGEAGTLEPVREALQQRDPEWHYWLLTELGETFSAGYWRSLLPELQNIASQIWIQCDSGHVEALLLIARHSLLPRQEIDELVRAAKAASVLPLDEYDELDAILEQSK